MELANSKTNDVLSVFLPYLFFFFLPFGGFSLSHKYLG